MHGQVEMTLHELRVTNEDLTQQNNYLTSQSRDLREMIENLRLQLDAAQGPKGHSSAQATSALEAKIAQQRQELVAKDARIA